MKIFGWAADDAGPGWYRLRVPLGELRDSGGHDTHVSTVMPDWVLEEADVVVGQRVCQPGALARWRMMAGGEYGHRPLMVFEVDDDIWDVDPSNAPAWSFFGMHPERLDALSEAAKLADVCTVSTEPLAEVVRKFNSNVIVLPNQLPESAFVPNPLTRATNGLVVGWGGGASHVRDVAEMVPGLHRFLRYFPMTKFVNLGTLFPSVQRAAGCRLVHRKWTDNIKTHYHRLGDLHVGLAPLRASRFNRSKSEIKFLEYAAAGATCIASKHGPYERVIQDGWTGLLVSQTHEWAGALGAMTDEAERLVLASEALAYAKTRHIKHHWQSWEQTYELYL